MTPSRLILPLGFAVAMSLFGDLTLYAVLVTQLDVVGLSLAAVGVMLGINRLIRIPGNPLTGVLLDRFGRRRLFILGMTLGVISTAGYALVYGFWPFLTMRLLWGTAWTLINVGGMTMMLDISTAANRGRLLGTYNTWVLAGLAAGPLVGGFLVGKYGFRPALLICSALTAIGWLVALLALPETLPEQHRQGRENKGRRQNLHQALQQWFLRIQTLWQSQRTLVTVALLFMLVMFSGEGIVFSTISLLLQRRFGDSMYLIGMSVAVASMSGVLLGLRSFLAGATGPLAGHLSDTHFGRWPVVITSLVIGIIGFITLGLATSPLLILIGVAVGAISSGMAMATLGALVGDLSPEGKQGSVMGAYASMGDIGSATGPFLVFALVTVIDLRWVYFFCAALFLLGLWLIARLQRSEAWLATAGIGDRSSL
ncbi:MAG: MFS transporter [Chloroflexi bacterium]|nr:MFS transporter [Chloroflexota bacterium]